MNRLFTLFLFILLFSGSLHAQDSLPVPAKDTLVLRDNNKYNFSEFIHESGKFIVQPVKWRAGDWLKIGVIGGITYLLMQQDESIRTSALDNPQYSKSVPMEIGKQWGGFVLVPVTVVALLTHGSLAHNNTTKKLGFEIAEAALYSEAISFVSKGCIGRARPFTNKGADNYRSFTFFDSPQNSFPAGHVDAAFALSTVLSRNVESGFLKVIAYIPAGLTAASRIYQDEHWTSDVFVGGVIGYFVGNWVVNLHQKKESRIELSSLYPLSLKVHLD